MVWMASFSYAFKLWLKTNENESFICILYSVNCKNYQYKYIRKPHIGKFIYANFTTISRAMLKTVDIAY